MKVKFTYSVPETCKASADLFSLDGKFIKNYYNQRTLYGNKEYINEYDTDQLAGDYTLEITTNNIKSHWRGVIGNTFNKFCSMQQASDMDAGTNHYYFGTNYSEGRTSCYRMPKDNLAIAEPIFNERGLNTTNVVVRDGIVYWGGYDVNKTKSYAEEFVQRFVDKKMPLEEALIDFPENMEAKMRTNYSYAKLSADDLFDGYRKPEYNRAGFIIWIEKYCIKDTWCRTMAAIYATRESDNTEVEFLFGRPYEARLVRKYKSCIIYEGDYADITGLAINDHCIYAAFGGMSWGMRSADFIKVYSLEGKELSTFNVAAPKKMICVGNYLYYTSKETLNRATCLPDGTIETDTHQFSFPEPWTCLDVSYDRLTHTISLASSDGSIRKFDLDLNEQFVGGELTNYWDNPVVYDNKFYWEDYRAQYECFLCTDINGLQFIGDGGNNRIQIFDRNFEFIRSIGWLSTCYHVGALGDSVWAEYLEFRNKKLAYNWGYWVTSEWDNMYIKLDMPFEMGGKVYARMQSIPYAKIALVELDPEYGIIIVEEINTNSKDRTQIYPDGCIYKDESGANTKITKQQLLSIDPFTWAAPVVIVNSEPRNQYNAGNNMSKRIFETYGNKMFLYNAHKEESDFHLTSLNTTTGKFIHNSFPSTWDGYKGDYIKDMFDIGNGVLYPGGQYVVVDGIVWCNYHGEFRCGGQANRWHVFDENLVALHTYGTDSQAIRKQGIPQPAPMMAGNSFSGNVVKKDSSYMLYHCDEGQWGGVHEVEFTGLDTIKRYEFPCQVYEEIENPLVVMLLKNLPFYGPLKDGDIGWSMSPTAGYDISKTDRFSVQSGVKYLNFFSESDIYVSFRSPQKRCIVSYPLDPISNGSWNLYGRINYEGNYHSRDGGKTMGNKLQIVDADNKVLVEFWPAIDYKNRVVTYYANNSVIFTLPEAQAEKSLDYYWQFWVWCKDSIVTVKYRHYPIISLGVIETKPARLRILIYNTGTTTFDQSISLCDLKFERK